MVDCRTHECSLNCLESCESVAVLRHRAGKEDLMGSEIQSVIPVISYEDGIGAME